MNRQGSQSLQFFTYNKRQNNTSLEHQRDVSTKKKKVFLGNVQSQSHGTMDERGTVPLKNTQ